MVALRIVLVSLLSVALLSFPCGTRATARLESISETELENLIRQNREPMLLVYWASWCVPCRNFREKLERIRSSYPEAELRMLAVSLDRNEEQVTAYLNRHPLPYPVLLGEVSLLEACSGMPVPTTVLYNRDGSVEKKLIGDASEKRLRHYVERIVKR